METITEFELFPIQTKMHSVHVDENEKVQSVRFYHTSPVDIVIYLTIACQFPSLILPAYRRNIFFFTFVSTLFFKK